MAANSSEISTLRPHVARAHLAAKCAAAMIQHTGTGQRWTPGSTPRPERQHCAPASTRLIPKTMTAKNAAAIVASHCHATAKLGHAVTGTAREKPGLAAGLFLWM